MAHRKLKNTFLLFGELLHICFLILIITFLVFINFILKKENQPSVIDSWFSFFIGTLAKMFKHFTDYGAIEQFGVVCLGHLNR